ncbi:MAG: PIN domain-containing protein [Thermoguttaceae bacterium]|jgi:predicted nucleic acid-binding protein|nr:PIN domain-containing protein [Thermoguttaceae bacterium]
MNGVFLDTVGMIAVWDDTDQWHAAAHAAYRVMLVQGRRPVTTSFVLCECGNAAARRPYRADVNELRQFLMCEQLVVDPSPEEVEEAWAAYSRGEAGEAGIVDHLSFCVMRRLGLTEAFTNDQHFRAAGFTALF